MDATDYGWLIWCGLIVGWPILSKALREITVQTKKVKNKQRDVETERIKKRLEEAREQLRRARGGWDVQRTASGRATLTTNAPKTRRPGGAVRRPFSSSEK